MLTFRYLDPFECDGEGADRPGEESDAEKIDEETFPIDVEAKTVGGITITSAKGTLNTDVWAKDKWTAGTDAENVDVDAVLMVFYYGYDGFAFG